MVNNILLCFGTRPEWLKIKPLIRELDNYKLCIVHTKLNDYVMLNYNEYESLIQNKRIQYQVNFKSHKDS